MYTAGAVLFVAALFWFFKSSVLRHTQSEHSLVAAMEAVAFAVVITPLLYSHILRGARELLKKGEYHPSYGDLLYDFVAVFGSMLISGLIYVLMRWLLSEKK